MSGREGSPGLDGNEVNGTFYLFTLYVGGRTDISTRRKRTRNLTHQIMFLVNAVVIESLYFLLSVDSCVYP